MEVKNIKKDENITKNETKIYIGPQAKINFNLIKVKFKKNELKIEEVLMSDECINDLKMNIRSKFKKINYNFKHHKTNFFLLKSKCL